MGISSRLKFIAEKVTPGNVAADIGTDHGYVPVYLVREGICPRALAMDMSAPSLEKARQNAERFGLSDKIECRVSDGFDKLKPGECDTVIISGMGGILITRILSQKPEVLDSLKEIILSPHRDADLVRSFLSDHGFIINFDEEISDKKKTYVVIRAGR